MSRLRLLDACTDRVTRDLARRSSRRAFVSKLGTWLLGGTLAPLLLPVARIRAQTDSGELRETGDPRSCDYWRYCAQGGPLCSCCGGTFDQCPPGTVRSNMAWIGTCQNPADGKQYLIAYNDCCGKSVCQRCSCFRFENEMPVYRAGQANDVHWCQANASAAVACTLAIVVGPAE
ncbi:MAG: methylamine dehydrogenase (amicyanin) light chain [Rhodospirillaceae bacterium]|nr:methylamine dehydrogenase (amicyanin) light chain [Rhodospirillaceae bacterium]